jgi:hypothetical protein
MSHHDEQWDGPDVFEDRHPMSPGRNQRKRGNGGCITILVLMTAASLALAYPVFGISLLAIAAIIFFISRSARR